MDKLIEYGLKDQDIEFLLDNNVDIDLLAFMDLEDIRLYI